MTASNKSQPGLLGHIKPLLSLSDNKRPWGHMLVVALAMGAPALIGAWLEQLVPALLACMGSLVILYLRQTPLADGMATLAVCSFGLAVSFVTGLLSSFDPYLSSLSLVLTVFLVTLICRFYSIPPPGSFFFILVACLARTLPFDLELAAERTGILLFGCMGACVLALVYGLLQPHRSKPAGRPVAAKDHHIAAISLEASVIGLFVGGGYLFALLINLDNPYWVPVSTAAIMQGATFRAIWHRNVQRIVGTVIGMGLAWVIFSLAPGTWALVALIFLLSLLIDMLITRNYGLAVIFVTPLTLIFAEASLAAANTEQLIFSRLLDIVLGSCIGYVGGWVIHHARLFRYLERLMVKR